MSLLYVYPGSAWNNLSVSVAELKAGLTALDTERRRDKDRQRYRANRDTIRARQSEYAKRHWREVGKHDQVRRLRDKLRRAGVTITKEEAARMVAERKETPMPSTERVKPLRVPKVRTERKVRPERKPRNHGREIPTRTYELLRIKLVSDDCYRVCDMAGHYSQYLKSWQIPTWARKAAAGGDVVCTEGYSGMDGRWIVKGASSDRHRNPNRSHRKELPQ